MVIDVHTHIFPDKIAASAIPILSGVIKQSPSMDGTLSGILASMEQNQIDTSIILPVITAPHQFDSIFRFAEEINEKYDVEGASPRLISFAGVHPDADNYKEQLHMIASAGFRGIKLHPDYQGYYFDDIRYLRILYTASELGLAIITHTGDDPYTPGQFFCSPDMILHAIEEVHPNKLILAHFGSNGNYEEAYEKICGQDVWLDTAYSLMEMSEECAVRMIHKHGAERILFGSDTPWTDAGKGVEKIRSFTGLSEKEKQQILYENAASLLYI